MEEQIEQPTQEEKNRALKRVLFYLLVFLVLTISCVVFAVLCIYSSKNEFFMRGALWLSIASAATLLALFGACVWLVIVQKETWYKSILSVYAFILFCLIVCFILQKTGFFAITQDMESLQNYLQTKGAWMPIVYIILQYLQVVILPIPSAVATAAGVALFGALKTFFYSLGGILLGTFTAFFIGRKLGAKAVEWMIGEDALKKWQKKIKGKDSLLLTLMFVLPFFPDDVLCFIAGLSSMSTAYFFVMIILSRIFSIATTCFFLNIIPLNTWWGLAVWATIIVVVGVLFIILYKNTDAIQAWVERTFARKQDKKEDKKE